MNWRINKIKLIEVHSSKIGTLLELSNQTYQMSAKGLIDCAQAAEILTEINKEVFDEINQLIALNKSLIAELKSVAR